jgi:hypothetical protein
LLSSPLFGAASNSQAIAPRKGGVTKEAVTSARTVRRSGISVRATSQPIGAAKAQHMMLELVARMRVVVSGSRKLESVNSVLKLSRVKAPLRSTRLK